MTTFPGSAVRPQTERFRVENETVTATRFGPKDNSSPRPALLVYTPYHREVTAFGGMEPVIRSLAARGYEVVVADMVGTGGATGFKSDPDAANEGVEAGEVLAGMADRSWCNGRLGLFGKSYSATTSLKAAAERPDLVDAIVPIHGPHTAYKDAHIGGQFALYRMGGDWLPYMMHSRAVPPLTRDTEWAEIWGERLDGLRDEIPWLFQYLTHQSPDEFWNGKDVDPTDIAAATLAVCGWRDTYTASTIEYYQGIGAPKKLLLGPWRHVMPHRGRESAIDFRRRIGDWFDSHLRNKQSATESWPPITYWTERDGGGRIDGGVWRGRETWPDIDDTEVTQFSFTGDGLVQATRFDGPPLEQSQEYDQTVGMRSVEGVYVETEPMDTGDDDVRSITVEGEPIDNPIEFTGTGLASLSITASTPSPLVVVRVVDVSPDGKSTLVSRGTKRLQQESLPDRNTNTKVDIDIELAPRSHVFERNHRVRVAISTAYFPLALPPGEQGTLTIHSSPKSPSTLLLPGSGLATDGLPGTVTIAGPDQSTPISPPRSKDVTGTWSTGREHLTNQGRVETTNKRTLDLLDAELTMSSKIRATVDADNPMTASVSADLHTTVDYGDDVVEARTESRVDSDTAHLETKVTQEGHTVMDQIWRWP